MKNKSEEQGGVNLEKINERIADGRAAIRERDEAILAAYKAGIPVTEISVTFGVNPGYAIKLARAAGAPLRRKHGPMKPASALVQQDVPCKCQWILAGDRWECCVCDAYISSRLNPDGYCKDKTA